FAVWHARRAKHRPDPPWAPRSVAVIIPAYNEEKVICASIQTLLASRLKKFKIIVVDDGSADRTAELVRHPFRATPRVSVLTKKNEGKWSALNYGLAHTHAQIVVTLDADTL